MADEGAVSRAAIVRALTDELRPFPYVHVSGEDGAAAFHRIDPSPDVDVCVVVDDSAVPETFHRLRRSFARASRGARDLRRRA